MRVTVLRKVDPVPPGDFDRPRRGRRFVGVRMRIENRGPGVFSDAPENGARALHGKRALHPTTADPAGCREWSADLKLAPGRSATGCAIFQVRRGSEIDRLRFVPDSGYSPDVATWRLTGSRPPQP